jgi:two-component system chemotaxis response regulator CheB
MKKRPINVLVVDDSRVACDLLTYLIESDPELKVVKVAKSGEEALDWLKEQSPDVITMDVQMPGMNGFEVTRRIMETKPIPIVIITSAYTTANTEMAFRAMEAGALAILAKPRGGSNAAYDLQAKEIINTLKMISEVKLVTKWATKPSLVSKPPLPIKEKKVAEIRAVAIGASLGGPPAIAEILSNLPSSFPVPILIVQHISVGFIEGFIKWLQKGCSLPIHLATQGEKALPGHVYIAPDRYHMEIRKDNIIFLYASSTQPSIGPLFRSMAYTHGSHGIGVILTGMGKDGAHELLMMRQYGACTIAQDESSSMMFGMPKEAIAIGAAQLVLPLNKIAPALIYLTTFRESGKPCQM